MKKYISFLLAALMILSTVSFATPSAVGSMDSAVESCAETVEIAEDSADLSETMSSKIDHSMFGEALLEINYNSVTSSATASSGWLGGWTGIESLGAVKNNSCYTNSCNVYAGLAGTYVNDGNDGYLSVNLPTADVQLFRINSGSAATYEAGKVYTFAVDIKLDCNTNTFSGYKRVDFGTSGYNAGEINLINDGAWHTYYVSYAPTQNASESDIYVYQTTVNNSKTTGTIQIDNIGVYVKSATTTINLLPGEAVNVPSATATVSTVGFKVSDVVPFVDASTTSKQIVGLRSSDGTEYDLDDNIFTGENATFTILWGTKEGFDVKIGNRIMYIPFDGITSSNASGYVNVTELGGDISGLSAGSDLNFNLTGMTTSSTVVGTGPDGAGDKALHLDKYTGAGGTWQQVGIYNIPGPYNEMHENGVFTLKFDAKFSSKPTAAMIRMTPSKGNGSLDSVYYQYNMVVNDTDWHTYECTVDETSWSYGVGQIQFYAQHTGSITYDNIELYWKPSTATVTVLDGDNKFSFDASTSGLTVAQIIEKSGVVTDNPYLTITGLNYDGVDYTSNDVLDFAGNITVVATWGENVNLDRNKGKPVVMVNMDNYEAFVEYQPVDSSVLDAGNVQNPIWIQTSKDVAFKSEAAGKYITTPTINGAFALRAHVWDTDKKLAKDGILTLKWDMRASSITNAPNNMVRVIHNNVSSGSEEMITATNNESYIGDGAWHTYEATTVASDANWVGGFRVYVNATSVDIKNVQLWWKPTETTVSYKMPDGKVSSITKQNVSTSGVTAAQLLEGLKFRGYYEPTAVEYAGVTYAAGDSTPIVFAQEAETVKVIAEARETSVYAPETIMSADVRAILGGANNGMRFRATMATAGDTVEEAGWIVTRGEFLTTAGLTGEGFYRDSDVKKIEGLNIDANGTNKIFASENNIDSFAAVLINIPEANYDDIMYARPFVVDQDGTWYGDTISGSYRQAAKFVRDNATGLDANTIAALNEVINA